jgi:hypothetical protein
VVLGIGALLLGLTFGIPAWLFRDANRYDRLLRCFAVGDWKQAEKLIHALRSTTQPDSLRFDLDIREAMIQATHGNAAQALSSPGLFEGRVASAYQAAGDYYALALVRDGRSDQAKKVLDRVAPILMAHGDELLLKMVQLEAGYRPATGKPASL